jgi:uncharacterized protein YegJ (DUF2314 family)
MMPPTTVSPCFRLPVLLALLCVFLGACQERPHSLPGIPVLTSPAPDTKTYSPAPSLRWTPVDGAEDYRVQVAKDGAFTVDLLDDRTPIARFVAPKGLAPGKYFWRVAAIKGEQTGGFSEVFSFTILGHEKVYSVPAEADLETMQRIVAEAAAAAPAKVVFAAGAEYRIAPERRVFGFTKVSDLEIDGNGATFIITNPTAGFIHFDRCERMTLRNVIIDYDPLPFSVGTVQSLDLKNGSFTIKSDANTPEFDAPHVLKSWMFGVLLDPNTPGRMKTSSPLVLGPSSDLSRNGDQTTVPYSNQERLSSFEPGDKYIQFARKNASELIGGTQSNELVFLNNTSYAAPASHYVLLYCSDAKVIGCNFLILPGRWFGGNSDGVHVRSSEVGPWVEGCTFEGLGDDSVAIYSKGIVILEKPSDTTLRLDMGFFTLHPGSSFLVFDPQSGAPVAEDLVVKAITDQPASDRFPAHKLVEFSPSFSGNVTNEFTEAREQSHETPRQSHEARIKDGWKHLQVFDRTAQHHQFMIRRNVMKQIRRFGVIIRAENGAVEENTFVQTSDSAITIENEPYFWRNGLQSENILIRNNTIRDCNFTQNAKDRGSINVMLRRIVSEDEGKTWKDALSEWQGHQGITIQNNTISQWQQRAISVRSASQVVITGNRVEQTLPNTLGTQAQYGIYLENVSNAKLDDNTIEASIDLTDAIKEVNCQRVVR